MKLLTPILRRLTKDNLKAIESEQARIVTVTEYLQGEISAANAAIEKHTRAEIEAVQTAANQLAARTERLRQLDTVRGVRLVAVDDLVDALDLTVVTANKALA